MRPWPVVAVVVDSDWVAVVVVSSESDVDVVESDAVPPHPATKRLIAVTAIKSRFIVLPP